MTQAATTTTLGASPNPATAGQAVTLTATVSPAPTGTPSGTVSFYSGSTLLGTGTVNALGVATFTTSSLTTGTDNLTAVYSGNRGFAASTSPSALALTVSPEASHVHHCGSVHALPAIPRRVRKYYDYRAAHWRRVQRSGYHVGYRVAPRGHRYSFNPPTVIPGSTGAQTVMTITLAEKAVTVPATWPKIPMVPVAPIGVALALCGAALVPIRAPRKLRLAAALASFAGIAMLISGCSGGFAGGPSTSLGSYVLTVTGTSGAHHPSTTVTIVVK